MLIVPVLAFVFVSDLITPCGHTLACRGLLSFDLQLQPNFEATNLAASVIGENKLPTHWVPCFKKFAQQLD